MANGGDEMDEQPTFDVVTDGRQGVCVFAQPCPQCGYHHQHGADVFTGTLPPRGTEALELDEADIDGLIEHRAAHCPDRVEWRPHRAPVCPPHMTGYWIRFNLVSEPIMLRALEVSCRRTRAPIDLLAEERTLDHALADPEFWLWVAKRRAGDNLRGNFIRDTRFLANVHGPDVETLGARLNGGCDEARRECLLLQYRYMRTRRSAGPASAP